MKINMVIDISLPISYLAKFWVSSYGPKCCQSIKLQDSLKYNISRKKWMMKFIFRMQINIEVFYKLILPFWVCITKVCVTRHVQSTKQVSIIFAISPEKHGRWSWIFACWWTPKVSSKWYYHFRWVWPGIPKLTKITSLLFRCNVVRKK